MKRWLLMAAAAIALISGTAIASNVYAAHMSRSGGQEVPQIYSPNRLMLELWSDFKKNSLEEGTGRTIERDADGDSTARGEALTLQRAAWMDDIETFDAAWQWTKDNLQTDDYHFSNSFGELVNGNYGLKDTGTSPGADASVAYGLIMGSARWREGKYLWDARPVLKALWDDNVRTVNGKPMLVSATSPLVLRPADFSPHMLRTFAQVDPSHDWQAVLDNTYAALIEAQAQEPSLMLAPAYAIAAGETQAELTAQSDASLSAQDLQLIYQLSLDKRWSGDARATSLLASYAPLAGQFARSGELSNAIMRNGASDATSDSPAIYGTTLGYFMQAAPETARAIYRQELLTQYSPDTQSWKSDLGFQDDTWAWLGISLYNDGLSDLGALYE